jgi:hypothetical protein
VGVVKIIGVREIEDIFFRELRVGVRKRGKGRVPRPIFVRTAKAEACAERNP